MYFDRDTKLFIDGGYYMFFCFNELIKNKKYKNKDLPHDIFEHKEFVLAFKKKFTNNLYKLSKKFNIHFKNFIFARDCIRSNIWRNSEYNEYKKNRPIKININNIDNKTGVNIQKKYCISNLFKYIYNDFLKVNIKEKINIIKVNELEADDIIAICINRQENNKKKSIIICEDSDLFQLSSKYTKLFNLKLNEIGYNNYLNKILFGDKTDNIDGIDIKYFNDDIIQNLLNINIDILCRNKKLIDFNCIPTEYKLKVIRKFIIIE